MRWHAAVCKAVVFALILTVATPALAGGLPITKGDPSPVTGRVLDDATVLRLEELLRRLDAAEALEETLKAEVSVGETERGQLRVALDAAERESQRRTEAGIRADERDKMRAEQQAILREVLGDYKAALTEAREEIRAMRKQAAIDRVLGAIPLLGIAVFLFSGGLGN